MRRFAWLLVTLGLIALPGCSINDMLFSMFGSGYSNGNTRADRQADFNAEANAANDAARRQ